MDPVADILNKYKTPDGYAERRKEYIQKKEDVCRRTGHLHMIGYNYFYSELGPELTGVRVFSEEGYPVHVIWCGPEGRTCIQAVNEGGHNHTLVDMEDLLRQLFTATEKPIEGTLSRSSR